MKSLERLIKDKLTGRDILQIRKNLNISQDKLSKILGVTSESIYLWEKDRVTISPENQTKVCQMLADICGYDLPDVGCPE